MNDLVGILVAAGMVLIGPATDRPLVLVLVLAILVVENLPRMDPRDRDVYR